MMEKVKVLKEKEEIIIYIELKERNNESKNIYNERTIKGEFNREA